jgi:hypothetical protein
LHVPDVPPLQQPFGQVVESHLQLPLVVSQSPFAQLAQRAPPLPHSPADSEESATHVPLTDPLQQPPGHDVASHTHVPLALLHSWPEAQPPHAAPPVPQEVFDSLA